MSVSPLVGVGGSYGANHDCLGRARTLKAIAALLGVTSVVGLLTDLSSLGAWVAGIAIQEVGIGWMLSGALYSAAMCVGVVLLWRLHPAGLLAILGWIISLSLVVFHLLSAVRAEGEELEALSSLPVNSMMTWIAVFLACLAIYLAWLLISPRTREVVFNDNRLGLQTEGKLAGTTVAALALIALVMAAGFVEHLMAVFA